MTIYYSIQGITPTVCKNTPSCCTVLSNSLCTKNFVSYSSWRFYTALINRTIYFFYCQQLLFLFFVSIYSYSVKVCYLDDSEIICIMQSKSKNSISSIIGKFFFQANRDPDTARQCFQQVSRNTALKGSSWVSELKPVSLQ